MHAVRAVRSGSYGRVTFFEIDSPVGEHVHPHIHLLFKVGGGDRRLRVDGVEFGVSERRGLLINSWQRHSDVSGAPSTLMLALYLWPPWLADRLGRVSIGSFAGNSVEISNISQRLAFHLGWTLMHLGSDSAVEAIIDGIVAETVRPQIIHSRPTKMTDYRIKRALRNLGDNPKLHQDFRDVARDVGLSRSQFYEHFRDNVGVAPNEVAQALVIERAYTLMNEPKRSLDEISRSLGFSTQSSFTRFFRDKVGFPPSKIRRQIGTSEPHPIHG